MRVHFTNFGYFAEATFETVDAALEYGRSKCFEFSVIDTRGTVVASWSPIGGTRIPWRRS
jgi:hypothetical protein